MQTGLSSLTLKSRLALTFAITFVLVVAIGGFATYRQSVQSIASELSAAEATAANRVAQLIAELPATNDVPGKLQGFVRSHNGDRDVRIMLIDSRGAIRAASRPLQSYQGLPEWFVTALSPPQPTRIIPLSGLAAPVVAVVVSIDPRNEIAETWTDAVRLFAILAVLMIATFASIWIVVERSLAPLASIQRAFERIGDGETGIELPPEGPPEFEDLTRGLNRMAARLTQASIANARLSEQIQCLQDEERAALARDLHDDIGPLLFAIDVDAGSIARTLGDDHPNLRERATGIRSSAAAARKVVRRILTELRPGVMPGLGLKAALEDHCAALAERHPAIRFLLEAQDGSYPAPIETTLFRTIREAVHNALKHGLPKRIVVHLRREGSDLRFVVADDGGGFEDDAGRAGFGLVGMRERIEMAGGTLTITDVPFPAGVRVEGRIPLHGETPADEERAVDASGEDGR